MAARYFSLLEPSPLLALLSVPSARLTCNGGAIRELAAPLAAKTNVLSGLPLGSSCVLRVSYTLVRTPVASSCVTFVTGKTLAEDGAIFSADLGAIYADETFLWPTIGALVSVFALLVLVAAISRELLALSRVRKDLRNSFIGTAWT